MTSAEAPRPSTSRGLRILDLATDAYGGYGGVALYNRDVLEALCADPEVERVVAVARSQPLPMQPLPEKLTYDVSGIGGIPAYLGALRRQLAANPRFDIIYCSHINLSPVAWALSRWLRIPWVMCIYGIDAWPDYIGGRAKRFGPRADHVISLSQVTLDRFLGLSRFDPARCVVVHNAIHLEQFGVGPKNPALLARYGLEGKKVIMTFGRLDPKEQYKGFDEIIALLPELLAERPELAYLIAGKGDDRARLEAKAAALGLGDKVIFTGSVPEEEKADTYRLADVYAMPSRGEGFGFVMLEAMACGVPAIGSNQDGTQEAVRGGEIGQVVDPADPQQLKSAILKVIDQPKVIPEGLHQFAFPAFAERLTRAVKATRVR